MTRQRATGSWSASISPDGSPEDRDKASFESLLGESKLFSRPIILRAYQRYASRINAVVFSQNVEAARQVYWDAEQLPSVTTLEHFSQKGFQLDGPLFDGSTLTYCFRGIDVLLIKRLDSNETARARCLQQAALHDHANNVSQHIVHFELKEERGHCYMLMPKLEATLEQFTSLSEDDAMVLWDHVSAGLRWLHKLGFSHADVKPANVGVHSRTFQLIDLGSVSKFDEYTSCTDAYVPRDFMTSGRRVRSAAALDWWMLGMTLAEKCCRGHNLKIGTSAPRPTKAELLAHMKAHLPGAVWDAFQAQMSILA